MKKPFILLFVMTISLGLITACSTGKEEEPLQPSAQEKPTMAVWNVYWDDENIEREMRTLQDHIKEIAYFDPDNHIFIPEQVTKNFKQVKKEFGDTRYLHYLSIVNDRINADGTSSLKDTELLYELFEDGEHLEDHMNHLVALAVEGGYDGIEIDYEGMKKDQELWRLSGNDLNSLKKIKNPQ